MHFVGFSGTSCIGRCNYQMITTRRRQNLLDKDKVFHGVFCRSLFVFLSLFFSPLCCLFFFDLRFLITPLVSPNFSWVQTPNKLNLLFIVDILITNGVDMPEEEFYDLMTKYDLKENGTFSYVEFLRHFILSLKPKEESNLMTRRRLPPTRASVRIE